jgi:hypothetical protein
MFNKINTTYAGLALALTLAISSAVYSDFTLTNGGTGYGYGTGYGVGYGFDSGAYSYRTTGGPANQRLYGYGYVNGSIVTTSGGGGGSSSYGGGVYTSGTTGTTGTTVTTPTTSLTCSPNFSKFMRIARANDRAEVTKLQSFLGVRTTGFFGPLTRAAVIKFQRDNGITPVSGFVFAKTLAKLNEKNCK